MKMTMKSEEKDFIGKESRWRGENSPQACHQQRRDWMINEYLLSFFGAVFVVNNEIISSRFARHLGNPQRWYLPSSTTNEHLNDYHLTDQQLQFRELKILN